MQRGRKGERAKVAAAAAVPPRMAAECGGECEAEEAGGVVAAALSLRGAARSRHRCVEAACRFEEMQRTCRVRV